MVKMEVMVRVFGSRKRGKRGQCRGGGILDATPMCLLDVVSFRGGGIGHAHVILGWGRPTYYERK